MSHTAAIFDRLCQYLAQRPDHTARVGFGPACEQWISSEAFVALNWSVPPLPTGQYVLCESSKRDIALFDGDGPDRLALATVEAKVVHPNKNLEVQLATLRGQIRATPLADETAATERGVIVYAVWSDWYSRRDTREEAAFHRIVDMTFRGLFGSEAFEAFPPERLRPIVPRRTVPWLGTNYLSSIYGACAALRPSR
jgi:hypothetical protein